MHFVAKKFDDDLNDPCRIVVCKLQAMGLADGCRGGLELLFGNRTDLDLDFHGPVDDLIELLRKEHLQDMRENLFIQDGRL